MAKHYYEVIRAHVFVLLADLSHRLLIHIKVLSFFIKVLEVSYSPLFVNTVQFNM